MSEEVLTRKKALFRILPVVIAIVIIILIAVIFASVKSAAPNPTISDKDSEYLTIGGYKVSKERLYTYLKKDYGVSELARLVDTELLKDTIAKLNADPEHKEVKKYYIETLFEVEYDETYPYSFTDVKDYKDDASEIYEDVKDSLVLYGYMDEADRDNESVFSEKLIEYFTLDTARKLYAEQYLENMYKELGIATSSDSAIKDYYDENYTGTSIGMYIPFASVEQAKEVMSLFDIDTTTNGLKESKWLHKGYKFNEPESATNQKHYFTVKETIETFIKMYNYVMANYMDSAIAETIVSFNAEDENALITLTESDLSSIRKSIFNAISIEDELTAYEFKLPTTCKVVYNDGSEKTATIEWEIVNYRSTDTNTYVTADGDPVEGWQKYTVSLQQLIDAGEESPSASIYAKPTVKFEGEEWKKAQESDSSNKQIKIVCSKESMDDNKEVYNTIDTVYVNSYVSDVKQGFKDLGQSDIVKFVFSESDLNAVDSELADYLKNGSTHLVAADNDTSFSKAYTVSPVEGTNYTFLMLKLSESDAAELIFETDDDFDEKTDEEKALSDAIKAEILEKLATEIEDNEVSQVLYENRTRNNLVIYDRYLDAVYCYNYTYFFETTKESTNYLAYTSTGERDKKIVASFGFGDNYVEITADQLYEHLEKHYGVMTAAQILDDFAIMSNEKYNSIYNPYTGKVLDKEAYQEALASEVANVRKNFEYGYFTNSQLASYGFIPAFPASYGWNNFKEDYFGAFSDAELIASGVFGGSAYTEAEEIFEDELKNDIEGIYAAVKKAQAEYYSVDVMNLVISLDENFDGSADTDSESWTDEKIALAKELAKLFVELAPQTGESTISAQMTKLAEIYKETGFEEETPTQYDNIYSVNYFGKFHKAGLNVKWETSANYTNSSSIVEEFSDELAKIYTDIADKDLLDKDLDVPYLVLDGSEVTAFSTTYGYHLIYVTKGYAPEHVLSEAESKAIIEKQLYIDMLEKNRPEDYDSLVSLTTEESEFVDAWYTNAVASLTDSTASSKALLELRKDFAGLTDNKELLVSFKDSKNLDLYKIIINIIEKSLTESED